jgi:hypothetical protein
MSTADIRKTMSPALCEKRLRFRLNPLLSEMVPPYAYRRQQPHPAVSIDALIDSFQARTATIPPKKYPYIL